ncbi:MAG: response regulator [Acidobacteria bacterium]|nr:response regulator [Acidobacteriota bacterium]
MLKHQHKVLFVDDDLENLKLAEKVFRNNTTILIAETIETAFKLLAEEEISLVVSDQKMPSMSGLDFLREVKRRSPNTIRFLLTGVVDSDEIHTAINEDLIFTYIIKPYKLADVRLAISRALENYELSEEISRLRQDWQKTAKETATLLESGSALSSVSDVPKILDRIVNILCKDFGYQACAIELIDKNSWELFIKASAGFPDKTKERRLTIEGTGLVSYVARTGKTTYLPDVHKDERYVVENLSTQSQLTIPLRVGEAIIGVLNIESARLDGFSERDIFILSSIADKAAAIVQQAHLFDLVSKGKSEWETAFDAISDSIFIFDNKKRLRRVNSAGSKLLKQRFDLLLGQYCTSLFPDEERVGLVKRVFEEQQRISEKIIVGEEEILMNIMADPILDEKKEVSGCVIVLREIT